MKDKILVCENLEIFYKNNRIIDNLSFSVDEGDFFLILGKNGVGKSTLLKGILGLKNISSGEIKKDFKICGYMSQEVLLKKEFPSTIWEFVLSSRAVYSKFFYNSKDREIVKENLKKLDLWDIKDKSISSLSIGQRQRVLLCRCLCVSDKIIFLDEPTSGLDPTTSKKIHELLLELKEAGTTIFLTTHDMNEATLLCDRLSLLNRGHLIEYGTPSSIIQKYNHEKKVQLTFVDETQTEITFEELGQTDLAQVVAIHSCEPTLEDIFIKLTGEKLDV